MTGLMGNCQWHAGGQKCALRGDAASPEHGNPALWYMGWWPPIRMSEALDTQISWVSDVNRRAMNYWELRGYGTGQIHLIRMNRPHGYDQFTAERPDTYGRAGSTIDCDIAAGLDVQ